MNIPEKFWRGVGALAAVLVLFVLVLTVKEIKTIGYVGANPNQTNTINVTGTGEAVAIPDIATFSLSVSEMASTVAEAQEKATTKSNEAIKALRDAGIEDRDIRTQGYNINPRYEYQNAVCPASTGLVYCPPGRSVLTGYEVSQTIGVKIRELEDAGSILATIGSLEVSNVGGLAFSVEKPEDIQAEARAEAIAEAEAKAKVLARQLGVRLVRIVSFSENDGNYGRAPYAMMANDSMVKSESAPSPEIPVGEQQVVSTVSITYQIK